MEAETSDWLGEFHGNSEHEASSPAAPHKEKQTKKKGHFIFLPDCPEYTNEH